MCGINGIYAFNPSATLPERGELIATREHMRARGPDGAGEWWSADARVGFGHRRLSIIDLSDRASQPMASGCGRYTLVFNGEIYNYAELRDGLQAMGRSLRTHSDTEVLLHLYELHGEAMVHQLRGMFAFAIWDNRAGSLFMARDPYGIKPLYTCNDGWSFRFASQVKALLAGGKVSRDPEPAGVVGFHIWGSVPEPFTLYRDIRCLPAGHTQMVDAAGAAEPKRFASIAETLIAGRHAPAAGMDAKERLREALLGSVRAHLVADVEVGLFLSSGVDSGALLGVMKDAGKERIRTITLSFAEFDGTANDEVPLAGQMARYYGAEHSARVVTPGEFAEDLPAIMAAMDQPTIDGVNSWFVCKAAHEAGLKVALSGVGGDELLCGYPSFRDIPRWVNWLKLPAKIPGAGAFTSQMMRHTALGVRNPKTRGLLKYGGDYAGAYLLRRGLFMPFELDGLMDPEFVRMGLDRLRPLECMRASLGGQAAPGNVLVSVLESENYLRNQLLRDADWTSMAHSLELRTPLVDFELLKAMAPLQSGLTEGMGKRGLADAPSQGLPDFIVNRPKTGFNVPIGAWMAEGGDVPNNHLGAISRNWALKVLQGFADAAR